MNKWNIDFIGKAPYFFTLSTIMLILIVFGFFTKGLNYGVDFRGGAEVQVKFGTKIELSTLRSVLSKNGQENAVVQTIGDESENEFLIRLAASESELTKVTSTVSQIIEKEFSNEKAEIRKTDVVGPKAGADLRRAAFQALFWALLAILIYIGLRFDFVYAPGAVVATIHDALIIFGVFILTQREFSLQIVAAILAVIGYSVNDTVVIYDRVRELQTLHPGEKLRITLNKALNETLSRTILTSLTVWFVVMVMLFMGGPVTADFFFATLFGVISGVYSTIYIASPVSLFMEKLFKMFRREGTK